MYWKIHFVYFSLLLMPDLNPLNGRLAPWFATPRLATAYGTMLYMQRRTWRIRLQRPSLSEGRAFSVGGVHQQGQDCGWLGQVFLCIRSKWRAIISSCWTTTSTRWRESLKLRPSGLSNVDVQFQELFDGLPNRWILFLFLDRSLLFFYLIICCIFVK